jgi:DNA polymerase-4
LYGSVDPVICHVDMDCFYASIEMRERPEIRMKPLAVGGGGRRGVVTTCNYVARSFGVRSAMPGFMARQRCPNLVFLPVRMSYYVEESRKIFDLIGGLTSEMERASIDEAYFRAPDDPRAAWNLCVEIRARVLREHGVTCSIGIAPNKMLAKIMSSYRKPDALLLLREEQIEGFMKTLDVGRIPGVGPKARQRLSAEGIKTCGDLQRFSPDELASRYGQWGLVLFERIRGRDARGLDTRHERKSMSLERTLMDNIVNEDELLSYIGSLHQDLLKRFDRRNIDREEICKAFVRFKYADFRKSSHECVTQAYGLETFEKLALDAFRRRPDEIRLVGLGVRFETAKRLPRDPRQLSLWGPGGVLSLARNDRSMEDQAFCGPCVRRSSR